MYNIKVALAMIKKLNLKESTLITFSRLLTSFQKFLDSKEITNPQLEHFLDFHKSLQKSNAKNVSRINLSHRQHFLHALD